MSIKVADYDAPRGGVEIDSEEQEQSLKALRSLHAGATPVLDDDVDALDAGFGLPDADVTDEEPVVRVLPRQADEFTCTRCHLVHHRSQLADRTRRVCADCA